jgi:hypothetical protein
VLLLPIAMQWMFEDITATGLPVLSLQSGTRAKLAGSFSIVGSSGPSAGVIGISGSETTLEVEGKVCASYNTTVENPGVGSFLRIADGGSLRVAGTASVQVGGEGPNVFIDAGNLFCGTDLSTSTWQQGSYDVTGDLCACTRLFQQPRGAESRTCDSCGGAGWDPQQCACKVRAACWS